MADRFGERTVSMREDIFADSLGRAMREPVCISGCVCVCVTDPHTLIHYTSVCIHRGKHNNSPCRLNPGEEPVEMGRERKEQV